MSKSLVINYSLSSTSMLSSLVFLPSSKRVPTLQIHLGRNIAYLVVSRKWDEINKNKNTKVSH